MMIERDPNNPPAASDEPQPEQPLTPEEIQQLDDYIEEGLDRSEAEER